jgi:hypothetical protein
VRLSFDANAASIAIHVDYERWFVTGTTRRPFRS